MLRLPTTPLDDQTDATVDPSTIVAYQGPSVGQSAGTRGSSLIRTDQALSHAPDGMCSRSDCRTEDGLHVNCLVDGRHAGRFALELTTVAASAVRADEQRLSGNDGIAAGELQRQIALSALLSSIEPGQRLSVVHTIDLTHDGRPEYCLRIEGDVLHDSKPAAAKSAGRLLANLRVALGTGYREFFFSAREPKCRPESAADLRAVRIVPASIRVGEYAQTQAGFGGPGLRRRPIVSLPLVAGTGMSFLDGSIPALLAFGRPAELRIDLTGRAHTPDSVDVIADLARRLSMLDLASLEVCVLTETFSQPTPVQLKATEDLLARWVARTSDVRMSVSLSCVGESVPVTIATIVGREIMQGKPFRTASPDLRCPADELDLSDSMAAAPCMPPLLPSPACLSRLGMRSHFEGVRVRSAAEGLLLGDACAASTEDPVHLGSRDRQQHIYLIGETGSGKSTAMLNMFLQDVQEAGRGAMLIDPKGDLVREARERLSPERLREILDIDFTDIDCMPGLNLLEVDPGSDVELACNQTVQDLNSILQRKYGSVPESIGPFFWMHMRNSIALLMKDRTLQHTLPDLPRIYSDSAFLAYLLQNCGDEDCRDFWRGIARPATGDSSLTAIASYVCNKFTETTQNPRVRASVEQARSTFNLREAMDTGRPVLVNLAKGQLNEQDTRFLGMLVMSKLAAAAASRVSLPIDQRRAFNVYIDEIANCATDSLATMLSESRAYGITLTVAHQSLGQLPSDVRDAVLANTSTKIMFRVSAADAEGLAQYISPHYTAHDLTALPDHHAIVRAKFGGVPASPFVMRTRAPVPAHSYSDASRPQTEIVKRCDRMAYQQQEKARRDAFLPRLMLDEDLVSLGSSIQLQNDGVRTLLDMAKLEPDKREEVLSHLNSARDGLTLRMLVRRLQAGGMT